jgi:hypothetical protein
MVLRFSCSAFPAIGSTIIPVPSAFNEPRMWAAAPDRVTHVMQAIEAGHELVVVARVLLRQTDLEPGVPRDTVRLGMSPRILDRAKVEVVTNELRSWECLGHQSARWTNRAHSRVPHSGPSLELQAPAARPRRDGCDSLAGKSGRRAEHAASLVAPGDTAA